MFIIFLKFSDNKSRAPELMDGHKAWLKQGFAEGAFLLAGSLEPGLGGGILSNSPSLAELQTRVNADPFVAEKVVSAEIIELDPGMADERLRFLLT